MEGLACKRESLKRRSTVRWERASSSRSTRASRVWATLRLRAVASVRVGSSCWLMVARFSCSSFCCSAIIGSLLGMQDESVVVGQRQRIGGQFVELWVLQAKPGLHLALHLLLAKDIADVVGAERAGGMGFLQSGGDGFRPVLPNQFEQFPDLARQRAVGIGQALQVEFASRAEPSNQALLGRASLGGGHLGEQFF